MGKQKYFPELLTAVKFLLHNLLNLTTNLKDMVPHNLTVNQTWGTALLDMVLLHQTWDSVLLHLAMVLLDLADLDTIEFDFFSCFYSFLSFNSFPFISCFLFPVLLFPSFYFFLSLFLFPSE